MTDNDFGVMSPYINAYIEAAAKLTIEEQRQIERTFYDLSTYRDPNAVGFSLNEYCIAKRIVPNAAWDAKRFHMWNKVQKDAWNTVVDNTESVIVLEAIRNGINSLMVLDLVDVDNDDCELTLACDTMLTPSTEAESIKKIVDDACMFINERYQAMTG